jgi:hypothetical protein
MASARALHGVPDFEGEPEREAALWEDVQARGVFRTCTPPTFDRRIRYPRVCMSIYPARASL